MSDLTRAEKKAEEVRQKMKNAMVSLSSRTEVAAAVTGVVEVEEKTDLKQDLVQKDQAVLELEQKIIVLEGEKAKMESGYEQRLKQKDVIIDKLKTKVRCTEELESKCQDSDAVIKEQEEKITRLEAVEEENKKLHQDLEHLRKTKNDQKMVQEALIAAEAKLSSKIEENNSLQTKLDGLLRKLQVRSEMTKALSELDNDIAEFSMNQDGFEVPDSYTKSIFTTCHAIDVEKLKESISCLHVQERDDSPVEEAEVEVDTPMEKLARVLACGNALPLSAE